MTEPAPQAPLQEAADGGATSPGGYLACITPGCGDEDMMDLDQTTGLCGMCSRQKERQADGGAIPSPEAAPDDAMWRPLTAAELEAAVNTVMPLDAIAETRLPPIREPLDPGIRSAVDLLRDEGLAALTADPMQQRREAVVARLLALGAEEEPGHPPTTRVFRFKYEFYTVPVSYPAEHMEAAMQSVERACDRLESLMAGRWSPAHTAPGQPPAPSPTLAEVQAELARERAMNADLRTMHEEAVAARRKEEGLRIHAETDLIRERKRAEDALESLQELRDIWNWMRAELNAVRLIMQRLGACGPDALTMLMRLLPVASRRALLEIEAADARAELARARANVVTPPPPEKLAEYAGKLAEIEAKIAALDAGEVKG